VANAAPAPDPPPGEAEPTTGATDDAMLLGTERLPPPAPTPEPRRTPRPGPTTPRPVTLGGVDMRPIPRAPVANRRREGGPAAPPPAAGVTYPLPGDDDDAIPSPPRRPAPPLAPVPRSAVRGAIQGAPGSLRFRDGVPNDPKPEIPQGGVYLSPRMTAIFGGLFGLAILTSVIALLIQVVPPRDERAMIAGSASAMAPGSAAPPSRPEHVSKKRVRVALPGPWRLSELEKDTAVRVERGEMEKKSLFDVLEDKGVQRAEVYRILKSLDGLRKFDKSRKHDKFAVAVDRGTKKVKAFEYEVSPSEVYQAREGDGGLLTGSKLDMKVADDEFAGAFYVGKDVPAAFADAGFEDGILGALDDALAGHMSTEGFEEGGTVRAIAVEETALGLFSHYKRIVAMEYRPPDPAGKPVRIYAFSGQEAHGYWDDKGRQPFAGGWRAPITGAPVSSPFNPKRMHPVLHTIMPHTGTDFGAAMGTPIFSAYRGTILSAGPLGPCGNAVTIQHANNIVTGYCHMSRFAGLKAGDKVGTRQLIGYVGATGRATGPHLHFFAKKDGKFFDAMTLHLDGDRAVPGVDRGAFLATKADLDRRLDAIPLPDPLPDTSEPVAVATSASAEPADAPPAKEGKDGKDGKGSSGGRRAAQIGSPSALAAAQAEPGIHPSQFVEVKGDDDDDGPPAETPGDKGKAKGKPDPAEEEDDER
jgi:murein DD-endopeptidase MepM/ murein hydrolase activator NlpD